MIGNQPVIILKEGTRREKGRGARSNNIMAARAVADAVRSTLGPKGMDKMLVDSMGDVLITNDGATILKEIDIEHPAAKMLVELAKTQDQEAGDGTTTAVVLAGELLRRAEDLMDDVHPTLVTRGYRLGADKAVEVLRGLARAVTPDDEKTLQAVALTSMSSKSARAHGEHLAAIAVSAARSVADAKADGGFSVDLDHVKIVKKTGESVDRTEVVDGLVIDKERVHDGMPDRVTDAKVALVNAALEVKKPEVSAKILIREPSALEGFLAEEERILAGLVDAVKNAGANVLFCQKGIDDIAQHHLAKAGIYAVRRVKKSDMEALARATGARIVSDLKDLTASDLGRAGAVEERRVADDDLTFVTGCASAKSVSVLLRGGTEQVVDELERSLHDALGVVRCVLEDGRVLAGAGAPEVEVALRLREYAATVGGREQLAIEAFADAVEVVPRALAENAGLDAIDALVDLRAAHEGGTRTAGLDVATGKARDAWDAGVVETLRGKTQAIASAVEAANMILRIDDVIAAAAPKPSKGKHGAGDDHDSG